MLFDLELTVADEQDSTLEELIESARKISKTLSVRVAFKHFDEIIYVEGDRSVLTKTSLSVWEISPPFPKTALY